MLGDRGETEKGTRLYGPILFSVALGTRRGETLAVRWVDLDLEAGIVSIRRSIEQTKDSLRFKETKGKGARILPLPGLLVEALKSHETEQKEQAATLGREHNSGCLVFPNDGGGIWRPDNFTSAFVTLTEKSGLKGVRFHDLRHSHASQLLRQGVHPKIVQERLGHSGIAVTMDIYSHVLPGMQEQAAQGFDDALRSAIKKISTTRAQ
ncbi:MAG TPA: site-specific integrase [Bryobacteraceae bacterium]|nr:site-specific integrase [Bryobacteraceae bacterium]